MKRFLSAFCALAMLLSVLNLAVFASAEDDAAQNVQSTEATGVITLQEDTADLTVTEDTYLDLNGYDITNVVVTGGTLYCSDSKTDDYAVADGDYGKITGTIEGNVVADQGYLQIAEADGISFHCVNLEIYAMTLRPDAAGVYYTSNFAGDEMVAAQVETYGVALSVRGEPAEGFANCGYSQFTGFQAGLDANKASTTLLKNIMNESNTDRTNTNNANTKIYGRAYIQTAEGTVFGESVCWTLKELVEAIDKVWKDGLEESQKTALVELYNSYTATMGTWELPNMHNFLLYGDEPTIEPEIKFDTLLVNNAQYLYRVGNADPVMLKYLFAEHQDISENNPLQSETVEVTVTSVTDGVTYTYTPNTADWTQGTIQFSGTGVVKLSITDGTEYCIPTELALEVVEAVNVVAATTDKNAVQHNVVLLQDISSGFNVSNGYTFYGNGFKTTIQSNGSYGSKALNIGFIHISDGGVLDNLQVICDIFPVSALYSSDLVEDSSGRYLYALSAVVISGDSTISNCYIEGARNNIFVTSGNVTISNTITKCGSLANVHIQKSSSDYVVTLDNLTTIQYRTTSEYDTSMTVMGFGILVGDNESASNPTVKLTGDLRQYNWVTSEDAAAVSNKYAQLAINSALEATAYQHTINGNNTVNMGIVYLNSMPATVVDERSNQSTIPYVLSDITMSGQTGQVCSIAAGSGITEQERFDATTDGVTAAEVAVNRPYAPIFKVQLGAHYDENLTETDPDDSTYCYMDAGTLKVMFMEGGSKILPLLDIVNINKYTGADLGITVSCVDASGNPVALTDNTLTLTAEGTYKVIYTGTDSYFYDKDGNHIAGKSETVQWELPILVNTKEDSLENAYFSYVSENQIMYYGKTSAFAGGNTQCIPFLAGLKIYDYNYNSDTAYLRFDGDSDFNKIAAITSPVTQSDNDVIFTVTFVDGGVLTVELGARADSGGSTYSGSIKVKDGVAYYVNAGTTSATTTTWKIDSYKFVGNNGVEISDSTVFNNCQSLSTGAIPSSGFTTSINSTVTFDANGGKCVQSVGYSTSTLPAVTLPTAVRAGYIFNGWYTAPSGGTCIEGTTYTASGDVTLYAQWGVPCTVTFDANGGVCDTSTLQYDGTSLTLPTATREGYILTGWFEAPTGGTAVADPYRPSGDITLYAQWEDATVEVTVTYNANGGSCSETSQTVLVGNTVTLPTPTAATGYSFAGWYNQANDSLVGGAGATYQVSSNVTLYAKWDKISYTISYSQSNVSSYSKQPTSACYGDTVTITVVYSKSQKSYSITGATSGSAISSTTSGSGTTITYTFTMPAENVNATFTGNTSICFATGALVTLADGSRKPIEQISFTDYLLAWDFFKGEYAKVPAGMVIFHGQANTNVINMTFANGTTTRVVGEHGFFDLDEGRFVYLNEENVQNYIGHRFATANNNEATELVDVCITYENTGIYSVASAFHYNAIVDGMLTNTPAHYNGQTNWDFFNYYFEIGEDMQFDMEQVAQDIETYGLYTYEEFAHIFTYEEFVALNIQYFKIPIAKGQMTYQDLMDVIQEQIVDGDVELN